MSKQYNNTLQSFFLGGGSERLKAGSQYDAGPCVTSVYVFLRNTSDVPLSVISAMHHTDTSVAGPQDKQSTLCILKWCYCHLA